MITRQEYSSIIRYALVAGSIEGKAAFGSEVNKEGGNQKQVGSGAGAFIFDTSVGQCTPTVSKPKLKARLFSALETKV